jgi:ABC-type Fe3+-hydroxamate transport system substrate-binding protein
VTPRGAAERIVCLVPSLTEALFSLGLGSRVVGVTEWCVHPAEGVAALPKVGGTKNPDVPAIVSLRPDLVLANREENMRRDVERLERAGLQVWVTYPRTVREGAALLREIADLGASADAVRAVVEPVERAVADAERALGSRGSRPVRVFCPIWRDPWMSVGADTYAHDLLRLCGGENVFGERGDRRYPRVALEDVVAARPEVVLLPDEPYRFEEADARELAALPIPCRGRIHRIDGTLVSWYGPRIARAVETIRALLAPSPPDAGPCPVDGQNGSRAPAPR